LTPRPRMELTFYHLIDQCTQGLRNLEVFLDKSEQDAAAKNYDVAMLLTGRLDQDPLIRHVQMACGYVKSAVAYLSGQTPPNFESVERTIDDLRSRIQMTIAFAESVNARDYAGASEKTVPFAALPGKGTYATDYLLQITIPSTFFHVATAYSILRQHGVALSMRDYLGRPVAIVDV
jgi:hypothetical protein